MTTDTTERQQEFFVDDRDARIAVGEIVRNKWGTKLVCKGKAEGRNNFFFLDKDGDIEELPGEEVRTEEEFQNDHALAKRAFAKFAQTGHQKRAADEAEAILARLRAPLTVENGEFHRVKSLEDFHAGEVLVTPGGWDVVVLGINRDEQKVVCLDSDGDMEFYGIHELRSKEERAEHVKLAAVLLS